MRRLDQGRHGRQTVGALSVGVGLVLECSATATASRVVVSRAYVKHLHETEHGFQQYFWTI